MRLERRRCRHERQEVDESQAIPQAAEASVRFKDGDIALPRLGEQWIFGYERRLGEDQSPVVTSQERNRPECVGRAFIEPLQGIVQMPHYPWRCGKGSFRSI